MRHRFPAIRWSLLVKLLVASVSAGLVLLACSGSDSEPSGGDAAASTVTDPVGRGVSSSSADAPSSSTPSWSIDAVLEDVAVFAGDADCAALRPGEPIRIGYAADLGELGVSVDGPGVEGARLLVDLINCAGGVEGQRVELQVADVGGDALAARQATLGLLQWAPHAVIGPGVAASAIRMVETIDNQVPILFTIAAEPSLHDPVRGSFLIGPDAVAFGGAAATFALEQGWSSAAVLSTGRPVSSLEGRAFAAAFRSGGGSVVSEVEVRSDESAGLTSALAGLAGSDSPDVVHAPMSPPDLLLVGRQLEALGSPPNLIGRALSADAAIDGDGAYFVSPVSFGPDSGLQRFETVVATAVPSANPLAAALGADAVVVVVEAYRRSSEQTAAGLSAAVSEGFSVDLVTGSVDVSVADSAARPLFILQRREDNLVEVARIGP